MTKKNQLKKQEQVSHEIAELPEHLRKLFEQDPDKDYEQQDPEDFIMPRMVLMQQMHEPVVEGKYKSGQIVELVSDTPYTDDPEKDIMEVVPIYQYKTRALWTEDGKCECRSQDSLFGQGTPGGDCKKCPKQMWDGNNRPECSIAQNFVVMILGAPAGMDIALWSMRRSQYRVGKEFYNKTRGAVGGAGAMYTRKYRVGTHTEKGGQGIYWNYKIHKWEDTNRFDKMITDAEILEKAMGVNEMVKNLRSSGRFKLMQELDEIEGSLSEDDDLGT